MAKDPDSYANVYAMLRAGLAADGFVRVSNAAMALDLSPRITATLGFRKEKVYLPAKNLVRPWICCVQAEIRHAGYDPDEAPPLGHTPSVGFLLFPGIMALGHAKRPGDLDAGDAWAEMFDGAATFEAGVASILAKLRRRAIPLLHAHDTFAAIEATLHRGEIAMPGTGTVENVVLTLGMAADGEGFGAAMERFSRKQSAETASRSRKRGMH